MAEKRRGLGRGLGALISSAPQADPERAEAPAKTSEESAPLDGTGTRSGVVSRETPTSTAGKSASMPNPTAEDADRMTKPGGTPRADGSGGGSATRGSTAAARADSAASTDGAGKATAKSGTGNSSRPSPSSNRRKPRPVDMFFAPGKSAETPEDPVGQSDEEGSGSGSRSVPRASTPRRPQMPDVIGEARARAEAPPSDGDVVQAPAPGSSDGDGLASSDVAVSREALVEVPGATFAEIPVGNIHPNRKQPRTVFDAEDMAELVHSIKEVGLLQPIVVRRSSEDGDRQFELVMGERRWRATQEAGLETIPAIVRATTDMDLLRDALLENLHRSQLNPLEEAAAYQQLLQEFGCTQEELSARIGRSRPQISNTIRLMRLPALVQRRVAAGVLSAGHARALLALADPGDMERVAQRIVNEGLSVRATEELVAMSDGLRRPAKEPTPRSTARHERLDFLATALSDRLDTSVKITLGAKKGRVSIEFASVDDLNRIMGVIAPGSPN
ncbi:ParB/RepB/Spo0J family partition protein [Arthrobacter halodurans]|uniref:ParB/RepB/Spo0J family partition protein n=1 Tax=Arthrobacter halodurans TaxID=516699 RepID=A0ABV4UJJ1_9MICC